MRVAYVCADRGIPVFGRKGSSIHVQEVLRTLIRRNVEIELFAHRTEGSAPPGFEPVTVHAIPRVDDSPDVSAHAEAVREANDALASSIRSRPAFDAVYERYSLWSHAAIDHAREAGIPSLLEVNAPLIEEQAEHRGLNNRDSAQEIANRVFSRATLLLAVSDEIGNYLRSHEGVEQQVQIVPNAVDPSRFPEAADPRADPADHFTIGFVGSLRPWHGLHCLAEAFALLHRRDPRSRLLVVGDGPGRDELVGDLTRLQVADATELTGAVAPAEVPALLQRMHVAVSTTSNTSGFYFSPLKVFEYMAAGLPVVASPIGQLSSILEEGRTGFFAPPGDPRALAQVFDRLRQDPDLRQRVGAAARSEVLEHHTWDARISDVFERVGLPLG